MADDLVLHPAKTYKNGVLAGTGILADDSDASFVDVVRRTRSGTGNLQNDNTHSWIPALDPAEIPTIASVTLHLRAMATTSYGDTTIPVDAGVYFDAPGGAGSSPFADVRVLLEDVILADGQIRDYAHVLTADDYGNFGYDMTTVLQRFTQVGPNGSPQQRAIRYSLGYTFPQPPSTTRTLRIYETWLSFQHIVVPEIVAVDDGVRRTFS